MPSLTPRIKVEVSLVIEINQKNQSTHFPKAMHYFHAQNQERAAVCLSSRCSELVRFLALGQIKPQAPLLVVLLPSILLNFIIANIHSTKTAVGFPHSASCVGVVGIRHGFDPMAPKPRDVRIAHPGPHCCGNPGECRQSILRCHRLRLKLLGRLIRLNPLTFVLD